MAFAIWKRSCYAEIAKSFFQTIEFLKFNKVPQDRKINVEKLLLHSSKNYFFISASESCCQICGHQWKLQTGLSLFYLNFCCKRHNKSLCFTAILDVSKWAHSSLAPLLMQTQNAIWLSKAEKESSYKTLQIKQILFVTTNIFFSRQLSHGRNNAHSRKYLMTAIVNNIKYNSVKWYGEPSLEQKGSEVV